jgi:hypothetical protein
MGSIERNRGDKYGDIRLRKSASDEFSDDGGLGSDRDENRRESSLFSTLFFFLTHRNEKISSS